jgi:hypothetical protein
MWTQRAATREMTGSTRHSHGPSRDVAAEGSRRGRGPPARVSTDNFAAHPLRVIRPGLLRWTIGLHWADMLRPDVLAALGRVVRSNTRRARGWPSGSKIVIGDIWAMSGAAHGVVRDDQGTAQGLVLARSSPIKVCGNVSGTRSVPNPAFVAA